MTVKIVECPRDAMQGVHTFLDTKVKISYINSLLEVGFDTLDCGSFVSPKAIPQMRDTAEVLKNINYTGSSSKLLVIIANRRGAEEAVTFEQVSYLGFPLSVSETFQQRNTNSSIEAAFDTVNSIQELCAANKKQQVVYLSMGFGNPYGDPWDADTILSWVEKLYNSGIRTISLADTVGLAKPADISYIFGNLIPAYPDVEFGAHFHTRPDNWRDKVDAAWQAGCRRFDGAMKGYGGCPMADDKLTGNLPTENLVAYLEEQKQRPPIDMQAFARSLSEAAKVFA